MRCEFHCSKSFQILPGCKHCVVRCGTQCEAPGGAKLYFCSCHRHCCCHYHHHCNKYRHQQGCIFRLTCSYPELTKDHVLTSAYVNIFRTVTRNAVNKSVWRKKDCSWLPSNKHAMDIWLSSLRIRAHLSWRIGKHIHVLHVLRTFSTCSHPGW